jgi:murein DD-endopeptidase MepM/ murein hydrolase activator NlpD
LDEYLDQTVRFLLIILVVLLVAIPATLFLMGSAPTLTALNTPQVVGSDSAYQVAIASAHGISQLTTTLEQDGKAQTVTSAQFKKHRLGLFRHEADHTYTIKVGKSNFPALHDGSAKLTFTAKANDLRGSKRSISYLVMVNLTPPHVSADGEQHYINQGGSELVTFTPTGYVTDSGVKVGKYRFGSFPVPGHPGLRYSLFAYPWDLDAHETPYVFATNPAGNEARATFTFRLFPKKFRTRDFEMSDALMEKLVNQIDPKGSGDMLTRFLKINGEMRRANNQTLADLRKQSADHFLFTEAFYQVVPAVEAQFADVRNYLYHGKKVDQQVHLGFDLADKSHMVIPAANDGKVVFAENLGIYGNCVVIDHGGSLQSIYGHMSDFSVKTGDMVKRSQEIGHSGQTGFAGGDHLHYSMQVDGVQVNPVEWWDPHWIKDRVWSKVK